MENQEHLDILRQGVEVWNKWRQEHPEIQPNLWNADLRKANLRGAHFSHAKLTLADLSGAELRDANLRQAFLGGAYLNGADLRKARLNDADLNGTDLRGADLRGTDLHAVDLSRAALNGSDFSGAIAHGTIFGDLDLSEVKGLDTVIHLGPSTIGLDTIYRSQGQIPEVFLREAGVPETFITNMRALVASMSPIDFYSCFISYSSKDQAFAERLHADLQSKGVRCWFAPEDLKIGDKFWHRIDESIRLYDKLLVVLSEHSVKSTWVENEVMAALEKEQQQQKLVLFPIKLDETAMQTSLPWAANIRRTRHIGDFTHWKDHDEYQKGLNRLLRDLKADQKIV